MFFSLLKQKKKSKYIFTKNALEVLSDSNLCSNMELSNTYAI